MLAQQTTDLLHRLKLPAMAEALDEQRRQLDFVIARLRIGSRCCWNANTSRARIDGSRVSCNSRGADTVRPSKDVNPRQFGLDKPQLLRLATGDWIQQHGVLLITGPTGTHSLCSSP